MRLSIVAAVVVSSLSTASAVRELRIASPLTALTIWDNHDVMERPQTHRSRFLPRFRAGLKAEAKASKQAADELSSKKARVSIDRADWAQQVAASDRRLQRAQAKAMEKAYDQAVAKYNDMQTDSSVDSHSHRRSSNKYQFVGVVNAKETDDPITWYARHKPTQAKWSVRLVHIDRRAIIKDLINRGKIDLFARYENTGQRNTETRLPMVEAKYAVRERSWR